jgi:hypothetical protein
MMKRKRSDSNNPNTWSQYLFLLRAKYGNGKGYNSKKGGVKYFQYRNWFIEGAKYGKILDSGFYDKQAWCSLKKAWKGYKIALAKGELNRMYQYATAIQGIQRSLDIEVSNFPHLDMIAHDQTDETNDNCNAKCISDERTGDIEEDEEEGEQVIEDQDMYRDDNIV